MCVWSGSDRRLRASLSMCALCQLNPFSLFCSATSANLIQFASLFALSSQMKSSQLHPFPFFALRLHQHSHYVPPVVIGNADLEPQTAKLFPV